MEIKAGYAHVSTPNSTEKKPPETTMCPTSPFTCQGLLCAGVFWLERRMECSTLTGVVLDWRRADLRVFLCALFRSGWIPCPKGNFDRGSLAALHWETAVGLCSVRKPRATNGLLHNVRQTIQRIQPPRDTPPGMLGQHQSFQR